MGYVVLIISCHGLVHWLSRASLSLFAWRYDRLSTNHKTEYIVITCHIQQVTFNIIIMTYIRGAPKGGGGAWGAWAPPPPRGSPKKGDKKKKEKKERERGGRRKVENVFFPALFILCHWNFCLLSANIILLWCLMKSHYNCLNLQQ